MAERAKIVPIDPEGLPAHADAEQALLGAIMVNNSAYGQVADFLRAEHFFEPAHGRIYAAISMLLDRGEGANPTALRRPFDADGALAEVGGGKYLARLQASVVTSINARDFGTLILDAWKRRECIAIGDQLKAEANGADLERGVEQIVRWAEDELYRVNESTARGSGAARASVSAASAVARAEEAYKAGGVTHGVKTGLYDVDRRIGAMMPGELVILAGRPSMGKSAWAGTIARNAARLFAEGRERKAVYFHSAEMPAVEVSRRDLADLTGLSAERQRRGEIDAGEFELLVEASRQIDGWPYFIDETPQVGVSYIRHRARRIARRHGLGLIVVDHLQRLREGGAESRRLEIDEITGGLAALAKELSVPVLLLSQLSRAVESRDDKRPTLSDLRESGSIEQDADIVMFLYREAYYLANAEPRQRDGEKDEAFADRARRWSERRDATASEAELIVAKARQGRTGKVSLVFNGERSRFESAAQASMLPDYGP